MKSSMFIVFFAFLCTVVSYLDIEMTIQRENELVMYQMPITIRQIQYKLKIQLEDTQEYIVPVQDKKKKKKKSMHSGTEKNTENLIGVISATSLEGYSLEGWKRYFMEVVLFLESRYYHKIVVNISSIKQISKNEGDTKIDGVISFGPSMSSNKMLQLIQSNSQFAEYSIISIYRGVNDKSPSMQLGGFEQSFARGLKDGILFHQLNIEAQDGKWRIPVKSLFCMRSNHDKEDIFFITNSAISLSISLSSPYLRLPQRFASDLQRNFESAHVSCSITDQSKFSCKNMTLVEMALNFLQFKIDEKAYINISLADLKNKYDDKTKQSTFFIEFVTDQSLVQFGQSLFKSYYVSIDIDNRKMIYSTLNRFPTRNYGVYLLRVFICFMFATIICTMIMMMYRILNDPFQKNRKMYSHGGVRLVEEEKGQYKKVNETDD